MTKAEREKRDKKLKRLKEIKISRRPLNLNLAAFDQATLCGVAFQLKGGSPPKSELWDLKINTSESQGMKWIRFESRLRAFLKSLNINALAYELPAGRNIKPIIHSSKLIGVIEKVCVELDVEYIEFSASQIKAFATGNGNAGKPLMIKAAKRLWGYKGDDDNEADALHILHYLKTKLNS